MRMPRHRGVWVVVLVAATIATVSGLWIVTAEVRRLEQRQIETLDEVSRAETVRLALWRMDSWMTPRLAREAARSPAEYSSFYAPSGTVNRMLQVVPKGEVLTPSPLLISTPEWIPVYFETRKDGSLSSPQVPEGNLLDLASGKYLNDQVLDNRRESLAHLATMIAAAPQSLEACTTEAEVANSALGESWRAPAAESAEASNETRKKMPSPAERAAISKREPTRLQSKQESGDLAGRARASAEAQQVAQQTQMDVDLGIQTKGPPERKAVGAALDEKLAAAEVRTLTATSIGPFVPAWLSTSPPELIFVRRVREGDQSRIQGFMVDWPTLSTLLVAQITDLAIDASLVPTAADAEEFGPTRLASLPADLRAAKFLTLSAPEIVSSAPAVQFAWIAAIFALAGAGAAAVAGVSFGDRQARFASSVTHELRTPLTTFQLYAEMLRDGMIPDPARRQECLATLCRESKRLSHLVENVLSLARLERGTRPRHAEASLSVEELVVVVSAIASERAPDARVTVEESIGSSVVRTDRDSLSQIIANLVENAAKYGRSIDGSSVIDVTIVRDISALVVRVRDHGPGVSPRQEAAIWRPFDRAGAEGSNQPGLGLGLAVSRALAEGMGGSLRLIPATATERGARFELRIPGALA